jgi:hypothetical protein
MRKHPTSILLHVFCAATVCSVATAQCIQQPDGSWSCPTTPANTPRAQPTAMDIRVECRAARGSGTAVARAEGGGTLVVTSHHVVDGQSQVTLRSGSGSSAPATLIATDVSSDLALLLVPEKWPIVKLGDEITIGTPVQFRAFDAGVAFRKYFGKVVSKYVGGGGGYFATGASVPGNSGGGVYSHGKLVGVVWGNPRGGTAFVPARFVRALIDRALIGRARHWDGRHSRNFTTPPTERWPHDTRRAGACDCDERWRQIESELEKLSAYPTSPSTIAEFNWLQVAAAALGVSGPIGVAIVAAGWLLGVRRERGKGGPRDDGFRRHAASRGLPDPERE